ADFTIASAAPTVGVADSGGTYNGGTFSATASVAGLSGTPGPNLENVSPSLTYYSGTYTDLGQLDGVTPLAGAPSQAGSYTVEATFPGSADYAPGAALVNFSIAHALPTIGVTATGSEYGRSLPRVTATVAGVNGTAGSVLENVGLTFTYYSGTYTDLGQLAGVTPLAGAPSPVGSYTVKVTFPGSTDY